MSTATFHTWGCKVNDYETEAIWQLFKDVGYERTDFNKNERVHRLIALNDQETSLYEGYSDNCLKI